MDRISQVTSPQDGPVRRLPQTQPLGPRPLFTTRNSTLPPGERAHLSSRRSFM